ncbi:hypothetical protein DY000_02035072 [Brassica cretica]|uniref:Uncharacterized protein n=1 Tax=Brassica cretica TaxID=69181 RepID=A0ABQ7DVE3_BRACR|nr:hypothetical protein DY000_02035072 [Brassica cretica]
MLLIRSDLLSLTLPSLSHLSNNRVKLRQFSCFGDCRVLLSVVRSSESPSSCVSPLLLVFLCGLGGGLARQNPSFRFRSSAPGVDPEGSVLRLVGVSTWSFCAPVNKLRLYFPPVVSGGLRGVFVIWVQSSSHGGSGGSELQFASVFRFTVLSSDGVALHTPFCSPVGFCAVGSRFTSKPVTADPEVVYPPGPLVLYELSVKRVYMVSVDGQEGGNLRICLPNDGIIGWCHNLVPPVVVSDGLVSRFEGAFLSGSWQPSTFPALLRSLGLSSPHCPPLLWIQHLSSIQL